MVSTYSLVGIIISTAGPSLNLRLGIYPEMERPAILNRSMPSTAGATMSNPAFRGRPSSAFQRFVTLSTRNAIYIFREKYTRGASVNPHHHGKRGAIVGGRFVDV